MRGRSDKRRWIYGLAVGGLLLSSPHSQAQAPGLGGGQKRTAVLPDLVPFDVTVALCAPTVECKNCPPTVKIIGVKNQGEVAATGAIVVQLFSATSPSQALHTKTVNRVAAGGTVEIGTFSYPRECPGNPPSPGVSYRIVVDVKNSTAESNEQNNSAVWTLKGQFTPK